jgi:flagellar hook assembly protein FlgD
VAHPSVTTFHFALPSAEHVTFEIFNVLGQKVVTLADAEYGPGKHTVQWDCRMDNGQTAASGVYFARLKAGDHEATRKMMVVK